MKITIFSTYYSDMLNLINDLKERLRRIFSGLRPIAANDSENWRNDPLSHPDLQMMSLNQLADLQFDRAGNHGKP